MLWKMILLFFYGRTSCQINLLRFVLHVKAAAVTHKDSSADSFICLLAHCFGFWSFNCFLC